MTADTADKEGAPGGRSGLAMVQAGPLDLVQDGGRSGYQRFGVGPSGAMDRRALAVANLLVGNGPDAPAIEFLQASGTYEVTGAPCRVAVAGPPGPVDVNGRIWPSNRSFRLEPGDRLRARPRERGQRGYIAFAGRLALPAVMGSLSTHLRAAFGGLEGRALAPGDRLDIEADATDALPDRLLPDAAWFDGAPLARAVAAPGGEAIPVRVVLGPQDDHFTAAALRALTSGTYTVSRNADRMGYRLEGPELEHAHGYNIVSDAIATGSVQVPGTRQPIVLLADRQTTGGFPKIATVVSADLPRLAQIGPGERIAFQTVSLEQAGELARAEHLWRETLARRIRPAIVRPAEMTAEYLLARNLVTAYWSEP